MGVDVLDLTALQKKGILKIAPPEPDVVDLTPAQVSPPTPAQGTSSAFDFLSSFAQASASSSEHAPAPPASDHHDVHAKLDTILNKIEDTMYKIEVLSGRVAQMESRLSLNT